MRYDTASEGLDVHWANVPRARRIQGESPTICQADLREVQSDSPQGQHHGHLRESEAQATSGLISVCVVGFCCTHGRSAAAHDHVGAAAVFPIDDEFLEVDVLHGSYRRRRFAA